MANGDCPVGSANREAIDNMKEDIRSTQSTARRAHERIDGWNKGMIAILLTAVLTLFTTVGGLVMLVLKLG